MSIGAAMKVIVGGVAGPAAGDITHAVRRQNGGLPALVFTQVGGTRVRHMSRSTGASGIVEGRWQIDAYATTGAALATLMAATRTALDGYTGTPSGSGTEILFAALDNEIELGLEPGQGDAPGRILHGSQDYEVTWRE